MKRSTKVLYSSMITGVILGLIFGYMFMGYIVEKKIESTVIKLNDYVQNGCGIISDDIQFQIDDLENVKKVNMRLPDDVRPIKRD